MSDVTDESGSKDGSRSRKGSELDGLAHSLRQVADFVEELSENTESCQEGCQTLEGLGDELTSQLSRLAEQIEELMMEGQAAQISLGAREMQSDPLGAALDALAAVRKPLASRFAAHEQRVESILGDLQARRLPATSSNTDAKSKIDDLCDRLKLLAINSAIGSQGYRSGGTGQLNSVVEEIKRVGEELEDLGQWLLHRETSSEASRGIEQAAISKLQELLRDMKGESNAMGSAPMMLEEAATALESLKADKGRERAHLTKILEAGEKLRVCSGYMRSSLDNQREASLDIARAAQTVRGTLVHLHRTLLRQAAQAEAMSAIPSAESHPHVNGSAERRAPSAKSTREAANPLGQDGVETCSDNAAPQGQG